MYAPEERLVRRLQKVLHQADGMGGNAVSRAGKAKALLCGGLDADSVHRHLEPPGQIPAHLLQIGGQFWGLGQHGGIHIAYPVSPLTEAGNHLVQQPQAVRPRVGRVAVREQVPDISKGAGAQQGRPSPRG